jgi:hypothetical protein
MIGPENPPDGARLPTAISKAETLSYLTEIIHELQRLADKAGYRTLGAILGSALIEARIQDEERDH